MKRLFCIISSLLVCTSSVFAWNAESFVSDGLATYQPYVAESPLEESDSMPAMWSMRDGVSTFASGYDDAGAYKEVDWSTAQLSFDFGSKSTQFFQMVGVYDYKITTGFDSITGTMQAILDESDAPVNWYPSTMYYSWNTSTISLTPNFPSSSIKDSRYVDYVRCAASQWRFDLDVDGSSSTMDFSVYIPASFIRFYYQGSTFHEENPTQLHLYVNGALQRSYPFTGGKLDVSSEIVNLNQPITSAYVLIDAPVIDYWGDINSETTTRYLWWSYFSNQSYIKYSLITSGALDGVNDEAQGKINEHESIESEWTGSMTSNFDSLNVGDFEYPEGFVGAIQLVSGIFNDIWNSLGDGRFVYVFPLTLGIILLVIGRLSRFSGAGSTHTSARVGGRSGSGKTPPKGGGKSA